MNSLGLSFTPALTSLPSLSLSLHVVFYFGFSWPPTSHLHALKHTHTHDTHTRDTRRRRLCRWSCVNRGNRSNAASAFLYLKSAFIWQYTMLSQRWLFCFSRLILTAKRAHCHRSHLNLSNSHSKYNVTSRAYVLLHRYTLVLTETVQMKKAVWMECLDSMSFLDFGESHSWPGRPQGYISQTYTQQF